MKTAAIILAILFLAAPAFASPVYFEIESGFGAYKWGDAATFEGFPEFGKPRWDFGLGFEWSPKESTGIYLHAGFRYQALGDVPESPLDQRFVDGPRLAIKWRGRLSP